MVSAEGGSGGSRYGPAALPSEYKIHEGSIVVRTYRVTFTEEDLRTGIAHAEYHVGVEVDHVGPEAREGWVVLAQGPAHHVDTEAERASISDVGLESWVQANLSTSCGWIPPVSRASASARHDADGGDLRERGKRRCKVSRRSIA
jgi:hypothetical protein